jgi:oligopeptidase B
MFDARKIRLCYSSLITPKTWFDYDFESKTKSILKVQDVPLYDKSQYVTKRLYASAKDGRQIPLSVVHHKNVKLPTSTLLPTTATTAISITSKSTTPVPTILYGYGSYGHSIDPAFDYKRVPLLDRGVVYVIGHIRGGGEMGRSWYEDEGKYLTKMNTFTDFGACAEMLINSGITSNQHLAIVGRSAGGLLVGATVNMFPNLFKAAVADVPFVDALNTMADPNIPLTVTEWEEWGNPNEAK